MTDDHKEYVRESAEMCRREVDRELHDIRIRIESHTLTEDQAEMIATRAAQKAKEMTKRELIDDAKIEFAW